jgi:diguanylate cyclase (GGDEF)-like protein
VTDAVEDRGEPVIDPVTGAFARAELQKRLANVAHHSLLLFDVDHFKTVNDAYGHLRGDTLLRHLAERVQELIRDDDLLFRYGGDEFVILLPDTGPTEALRLAIRLTDEVRGREFAGVPPLHLSISLGVASYPSDGTDAEALIGAADRRNYLAKRRGRGQAVGDDTEAAADAGAISSRLWERDTALAATHEYLTRIAAGVRGVLRVTGPPGAGHTRFLAEVASIARMRGFSSAPGERGRLGTLILVDIGEPIVDLGEAAGLIYATTNTGTSSAGEGRCAVPVIATAELGPWSPATLRIWLRTTLQGEPSRALVSWLAAQTGGLPARAADELRRLRERGGLLSAEDGGWTLAPGISARPRRKHQLPVPLTRLIGRDRECARVAGLVRDGRLVTLVGPGGIGKTRLSLAVAVTAARGFTDGAVFVPLADAGSVELALAAIARGLQIAEVPDQPLLETVLEHLAEASVLLVLDNFEQIVDDAAGLVSELLAVAPGVAALITSRERLSLYGEQVYQVPALRDSPALTLFEQRARAVDADFEVTADTALVVATLCRRLDGLPLAIELAAARIDRWSPVELLDRLAHHLDSLDALGDGPRDLPARQQTLRGAIDWSFALLDTEDQRLFTTLAAFAGGWTADAALAVSPTIGDVGLVQKRLNSLVDKHLVVTDGEHRYQLLETIRTYAVSRLGTEGGPRDRHAEHYAAFAEESASRLSGPDQAAWLGRIEVDYQNVRAAFDRAASKDDATKAARICLGLWRYWRNGAHIGEGREWLDRLLGAPVELDDEVRARLLHGAAVLAATQDEHERAYVLGTDSLRRATAAGDLHTTAHAHNALGIAAIGRGDHRAATEHFERSLALCRELGVTQGIAAALGNLTKVSLRLGDVVVAKGYADECLRLERAAGNTRGIVLGLGCLGQILLAQGDVVGARLALDESLALSRGLGDAFSAAAALHQLGLAARAEGDRPLVLRLLTEALATRHEVGDRLDLAISLDVLAAVVVAADPALAARLIGAADALRERHRLPMPPESETFRDLTLPAIADLASARLAGRAAPIDLVVEEALDAAQGSPALMSMPRPQPPGPTETGG